MDLSATSSLEYFTDLIDTPAELLWSRSDSTKSLNWFSFSSDNLSGIGEGSFARLFRKECSFESLSEEFDPSFSGIRNDKVSTAIVSPFWGLEPGFHLGNLLDVTSLDVVSHSA